MRFISFVVLILFFAACSATFSNNKDATISFSNKEYDFGTLKFKQPDSCTFEFTNPGNTPLVVSNVKTSCGCTVAQWTKKPVRPGKNGEIRVKYDSEFPGAFHKTITVFFNGKNSPVVLKIKGKVQYPEDIADNK